MEKVESSAELPYWLALWRGRGVGSRTFAALLAMFPKLAMLFSEPAHQWVRRGVPRTVIDCVRQPDWAGVDRDLAWAACADQHILKLHDAQYPPLLKTIPDPPPLLFVKGEVAVLTQPQLAIVGSRKPTPTGVNIATDFSQALAKAGCVITSGLALGIDGASHQGAVQAGGRTIAVMATGADRVYPWQHQKLAESIVACCGALVSEFPVGVTPQAKHFPRRNRIISGLSEGVLVIEAAARSGSLITAHLAADQGREVFAVPGSIYNPKACGCHRLIRQGAKLTENLADILSELNPSLGLASLLQGVEQKEPVVDGSVDAAYQKLLHYIGYETTTVDRIIQRSRLPVDQVVGMLLNLTVQGYISAMNGGYVRVSR